MKMKVGRTKRPKMEATLTGFVTYTSVVRAHGYEMPAVQRQRAVFKARGRRVPRMEAEMDSESQVAGEAETSVPLTSMSEEELKTKDEILKQLADDVAADPLKGTGAFSGNTWDQDGKQNIWAIEPTESVAGDEWTQQSGLIVSLVAAVIVLLVVMLPRLNLYNPDQF